MSGRVLVLGANGFIGSHVAAALSAEGCRPVAPRPSTGSPPTSQN
jgi:nucleoside-diphosphate-sugar epimerase